MKKKLEVVKNYTVPTTLEQVRSFVGFVGFYRQYIDHFSQIASPLTASFKKNTPFKWTPAHQKAFEILRDKLLNDPILIYPNFTETFSIASDASQDAIAAALLQEKNGVLKPISYASRTMISAERNYTVTETKEGLTISIWIKEGRNLVYYCDIVYLQINGHAKLPRKIESYCQRIKQNAWSTKRFRYRIF